ncbi:MAG: outer membrane beta-barrel family protein, partial [Taibaiella sp.]|nr:outer membrane beta-barrel family protein [Taibaiella sp.]
LKDNGTLRLNVQDIFWTAPPAATSLYDSYREDFEVKRETRQVTLSFSYRFGNNKIGPARRRTGGAEDEKSRVGNS